MWGCATVAAISLAFAAEDAVGLSKDQKKVVERFGWPATFLLIDGRYDKDSEEGRYEVWDYPDQKQSFAFRNRAFMGTTKMEDLPKGKYRRNPLKPTLFDRELTKAEAFKILGKAQRVEYGQYDDGKVESYAFPDSNAAAIFLDDRLWTLKTNVLEPAAKGGRK
jgi:hypothetical protein